MISEEAGPQVPAFPRGMCPGRSARSEVFHLQSIPLYTIYVSFQELVPDASKASHSNRGMDCTQLEQGSRERRRNC